MKKLSIEEKAKAYDGNYKVYTELKNRLEDVKDAIKKQNYSIAMDMLCKPYPEFQITTSTEFAKSEDERIRKEIIDCIQYMKNNYCIPSRYTSKQYDTWIYWLGKQGKQQDTNIQINPSEYINDMGGNGCYLKNTTQKSTDNVEQKFKVGDWIIYEENIWKICRINLNTFYELLNINNELSIRHIEGVDKTAHLWTIQDAKDGDVLYECNEKKPFIFKKLKTKHIDDIASYCDIFNGIFTPNEDSWTTLDIVPATKEQRDVLFQKMKEAGYEWNAERKELKEIEQKSSWSEEDEAKLKSILFHIEDVENKDVINWFKSLKNRVGCEVNCITTKEWSEEDCLPLDAAISIVANSGHTCTSDWLKSLKDRFTWKPSDEQMQALSNAGNSFRPFEESHKVLWSLYNDLEKLRKE